MLKFEKKELRKSDEPRPLATLRFGRAHLLPIDVHILLSPKMDLALVIFLLVLSTEFLNWVGKSFLIEAVSFCFSVDG